MDADGRGDDADGDTDSNEAGRGVGVCGFLERIETRERTQRTQIRMKAG